MRDTGQRLGLWCEQRLLALFNTRELELERGAHGDPSTTFGVVTQGHGQAQGANPDQCVTGNANSKNTRYRNSDSSIDSSLGPTSTSTSTSSQTSSRMKQQQQRRARQY
jgi:hypothetical protein